VEAKCFAPSKKIDLEIVRGVVGVLKDVGEYWNPAGGMIQKQRYHYQYALFSATGYTEEAQKYAFAHDIYLIPLAESLFFAPVIEAIRSVKPSEAQLRANSNLNVDMKSLRRVVRRSLQEAPVHLRAELEGFQRTLSGMNQFFAALRRLHFALLAVLGAGFPVFLVPGPEVFVEGIREEYLVRISRDTEDRTWYLRDRTSGRVLFSFDLPRELLREYADQGMLTAQAALNLKEDTMSNFQALLVENDRFRLIRFRLDQDWLAEVRDQLG
jgi:hypothetical protein